MKHIIYLFFLIIGHVNTNGQGEPDFRIWQESSLVKLEKLCNNLDGKDNFNCSFFLNEISEENPSDLHEIYSGALNLIETKNDLILERYIYYKFSGEYYDTLDFFILKEGGNFWIIKFSRYLQKYKIAKLSRIKRKKITSSISNKEHYIIPEHSFIVTKFCKNEELDTRIELKVSRDFLDALTSVF